MERNIKERVSQYVDEYKVKEKLTQFFQEKIVNRKAMFIPITGVATFMLVGYAAADTKAPEITSDQIEIPYGEKFDVDTVDVTDNRDSRDDIQVNADLASLNVEQLGDYKVTVTATDSFNNETTKEVTVKVVDQEGPKFETLGSNEGYVVEVPVNGSNDLSSYVKATDNVDGDVTPFMESDKQLDTSKQGTQTINVSVSDNSGNTTEESFKFFIADMQAPEITLKSGNDITVDYGSEFKWQDYVSISDNLDTNIEPKIEGTIDTKQLNQQKEIKLTATDGAGNSSKVVLNATVKDITGPNIVLSTNKISVDKGSNVDLKSYITSAVDNLDGDMKDKITFNAVDTSTTGLKTVTYTGVDSTGNKSEVQLQVEVTFSGERIVSTGLSKRGCPYVWGSTGPNSFDCSGFTQWVYRQNGISIPRTSSEQRAAAKKVVSLSELQVGDILWRSGHVGIYIGNGQYVHAPHTGDVVKVSSGVGKFTCGLRYQ